MEVNIGSSTVHAAKFNVERFWEPEDLVKLPRVSNKNLDNIVTAFDEISYIFCGSEDYVLTSIPMNHVHVNYLHSIGFDFKPVAVHEDLSNLDGNGEYTIRDIGRIQFPPNTKFSTYGITDEFEAIAKNLNLIYHHPPMDVIVEVNSKRYSTILAQKLQCNDYAYLIDDIQQLKEIGESLLAEHGGLLLKEEYGVSGKGNLKISDVKSLERIIKYASTQVDKGKRLSFIIEPFLKVQTDFSVQYYIDETGRLERKSIQKVLNHQSTYKGSVNLDQELLTTLEKSGYFTTIEQLCNVLYQDGYYGDVCIDSMILEDGKIIPIVEINARKSMSLIKKYIEEKVAPNSEFRTCLFDVDLTCLGDISFNDILKSLEEEGILYTKESRRGVIPLTANTLFINRLLTNKDSYKGRLYFFSVSENEAMEDILQRTREVCSRLQSMNG